MTVTEKKNFYGWTALTGAIIAYMAFGGCVLYSYGVFLPSMCTDLAASRGALSAPYSIFTIIGGLSGPVVGLSITRFGARKNIIVGNLISGLSLIGMFFVTEIWHVYLLLILVGFGCGFGTFIPVTTIASNWFIKKRALALSLVVAALGVGGFVFPLLISSLILTVGWRWAWVVMGSILILLAVIVSGILIKNRPEDMGQVPEGTMYEKTGEVAPDENKGRVYHTPVDWNSKEALRSRAFWMILSITAINTFSLNIFTSQQVAYLQDKGFTTLIAASGLSLFIIISAIGKLLMGALGTRFESRYLAIASLSLLGIGVFLLMNTNDISLIYASSILSGFGYGGNVVLYSLFVGAYFGRKNYHQIIGWMNPFSFLLGGASPILAGYIYDSTKSYLWAFIIAVLLIIIGIFCALLAKPPQMKTETR